MLRQLGFLCTLFYLSFSSFGQVIEFENIGLADGLSQVSVMCVTQDEFGSMWMGTRNGLNRYDGEKIITYKTSPNSNSILENQIQSLYTVDSIVWISTPNSISAFNLNTEIFQNYRLSSISSFYVKGDSVWVATESELFVLNQETNSFNRVSMKLREAESITSIGWLQNELLIGTNMGLWKITGKQQKLLLKEKVPIKCLFVDSNFNIWVGTFQEGLLKLRDEQVIRRFRGVTDISNDFVRCVDEDDEGKIWVGTFKGLDVIDTNGEILHYEHNKSISSSLSHNSIWSLFKDREGTMWVGTYFGGVNIFHPTRRLFHYYPEKEGSNYGVSFRVVGQIIEDQQNNIWICTDGGGLNRLDRATGEFTYFSSSENSNSISGNNVKSLCWQGDSVLWIGTHRSGLNRFDLKTKKFTNYIPTVTNSSTSESSEIHTIINFENDLLIGTGIGLLRFDLKNNQFSRFLSENQDAKITSSVLSLLVDNMRQIWIGTEKTGLFNYDLKERVLRNYRANPIEVTHLPSDCIYEIFKDHNRRIWIGSSDGLSKYDPEGDNFISYRTKDGLAGNIVFGIVASRFGGMIIESNKGLSFFEPELGNFKNISYANGLPLRELTANGIYSTMNGELFISGTDGLVSFQELDFLNREPNTLPKVTRILINNKPIIPQNNSDIIDKTIFRSPNINLNHKHSSITLSISDMSFTKDTKQGLEYKLDGFDNQWIRAEDRNNITYTNLDDGKYSFNVRMINAPNKHTALSIEMTPPFYLSEMAIFIYILLGFGIILIINYQYIRQSKLVYSLQSEKESHQKDEELNQNKIRFFTNISHEFRTPLTLIAGQIDLLLENSQLNGKVYERILNIQKNTLRLRNLITELLDFRKLEHGQLSLKVQEKDFMKFINEIHASFIELAKQHNIDYVINHNFTTYPFWFDPAQLEKVFYNLLANAFKFTSENGQIVVSLYELNDKLHIEVINTGSVIPKELIEKVFDRFYQLENITSDQTHSTGIGLALTKGVVESHHGKIDVSSSYTDKVTTFHVQLKKGKAHFDKEDFKKDKEEEPIITNYETYSSPDEIVSKKTETLMIVEDNVEITKFLTELLAPLFNIKKVSNGADALDMVKESHPDIIVSDVLMPKMNGTEMCAILKSDILTSHIPIILLTARGSDEHRIEGLETGADDYISKPFNSQVLIARINNILNSRKALQGKYEENPIQYVRKVAKKRIDREFMEKAQEVILNSVNNSGYNVDLFSKEMGLGRTNLFLKIKGITGQTPNEFITGIRLDKAAQMILHQPETSIADIAYTCGFSNPNYFSKTFKKKYQTSPSEYRSRIENT